MPVPTETANCVSAKMTSTTESILPAQSTPGDRQKEERQSILEGFQEIFALKERPPLTLTNVYKELPISNPGHICDIRGPFLEVSTSELQLAAISQCNEAYIRSPRFAAPVLGRLGSMDVRRGLVQLCDFSFAELHAESRSTIRVRLRKPTNIIIHAGATRISGVIHDISLGGCCVHTLIYKGLKEAPRIEVELKVIDQSTGLPNCTRIPCTLLQVSGDGSPFKCVLSFCHNQQSEQFLSLLINQRQLEILKELREAL